MEQQGNIYRLWEHFRDLTVSKNLQVDLKSFTLKISLHITQISIIWKEMKKMAGGLVFETIWSFQLCFKILLILLCSNLVCYNLTYIQIGRKFNGKIEGLLMYNGIKMNCPANQWKSDWLVSTSSGYVPDSKLVIKCIGNP